MGKNIENIQSYKVLRLVIFGLIGFLMLNLLASVYYINKIEKYFLNNQISCPSDKVGNIATAAIVFYGDKGSSTTNRVKRAVELFESKCVDKIFMVGGLRVQQNYHGALWMQELAIEQNVSLENLRVGNGSYDTKGNLVQGFNLAKKDNIKSLYFISDPLHLYRIRFLANNMVGKNNFTNYYVNAQYGRNSFLYKWWRFNKEMLAFALYFILPDKALDELLQNFRN